jgi:hypothetical protein
VSPAADNPELNHSELPYLYVLQALTAGELPAAEKHIAECPECRREIEMLRPVLDALPAWPTDVLRPPVSLWDRLERRVAKEASAEPIGLAARYEEPAWKEVAPGISCKLLATDAERDRVSMLVRLTPGTDYPPHSHAGVEELHLLDGELWIDDRKLYPGDYNRAQPGTSDKRVWSETGCTCVLVTSTRDALK